MTEKKQEKEHTPSGNIWDTIFKKNMADTATALSVIQRNAPADILALCDLSTFAPLPSDFIDEVAKVEYRADVVYSMRTHEKHKHAGRVIFLIEHQSSFDPLIAWRVLHYSVNLMNSCQRQNGTLPGIVPMMIYHGKSRLKNNQSWLSLIQPAPLRELMHRQFFAPLIQIDLGACSDTEIITHGQSAPMELLLKHGRKSLEELLTVLFPILFNGNYPQEKQKETLRDICQVYNLHSISDLLNHNNPEVNMIDAITRLENESKAAGRLEGRLEGMLEGKREGRLEGKREGMLEGKREGETAATRQLAGKLLSKGIDWRIVMECSGLSKEELEALRPGR